MITPETVSGLEFVLQSSGQTERQASWFMQISHLPFHFPLEAGKGWVYIKTKSSQFYTFDVHLKKQKTYLGYIPLNQKRIILSCLNYGYFPFV